MKIEIRIATSLLIVRFATEVKRPFPKKKSPDSCKRKNQGISQTVNIINHN